MDFDDCICWGSVIMGLLVGLAPSCVCLLSHSPEPPHVRLSQHGHSISHISKGIWHLERDCSEEEVEAARPIKG